MKKLKRVNYVSDKPRQRYATYTTDQAHLRAPPICFPSSHHIIRPPFHDVFRSLISNVDSVHGGDHIAYNRSGLS